MSSRLTLSTLSLLALAACATKSAPAASSSGPTPQPAAPSASAPTPQPAAPTANANANTNTNASANAAAPGSVYELTMNLLNGTPQRLDAYKGKVVLVVNTASECGFTPQYEGLEALYKELSPQGLVILGFPSNDFGHQEPGSSEQIATFCRRNYGVTFPMFEKITVKGEGTAPLYQLLTRAAGEPRWNFHKYLIDKKGTIVKAFPSAIAPDSAELRAAIRAALDAT